MINARIFKEKYNLWRSKAIRYCDGYESLTDGKTHIVFEEDKILVCSDDGEGNPEYYDAVVFPNNVLSLDSVFKEYKGRK